MFIKQNVLLFSQTVKTFWHPSQSQAGEVSTDLIWSCQCVKSLQTWLNLELAGVRHLYSLYTEEGEKGPFMPALSLAWVFMTYLEALGNEKSLLMETLTQY